ncbi:MAG: hypothetical protein ACRDYX_15465, partial [Egibacteraceae bacterium]
MPKLYAAAGFVRLGETLGCGRSAGAYVHHGNPKLALARGLRRDAAEILSACFDRPVLTAGARRAVIDLNASALDGPDGLLAALEGPDPRHRRGVRHRLASVLAIAAAATLAGAQLHRGRRVRGGAWRGRAGLSGSATSPGHGPLRVRRRCAERSDALDAAVGGWLSSRHAFASTDIAPPITVCRAEHCVHDHGRGCSKARRTLCSCRYGALFDEHALGLLDHHAAAQSIP